jgi:hypothetical protein
VGDFGAMHPTPVRCLAKSELLWRLQTASSCQVNCHRRWLKAGRECNDEKLAQQLSLIVHRKSDYTHALAKLFCAVTACIACASNESFPESFFASLMMQRQSARKRLARARKVNDDVREHHAIFMRSRIPN